jgi:hypothetical protein
VAEYLAALEAEAAAECVARRMALAAGEQAAAPLSASHPR